ncbi:MAG: C25 family cysteine peptidase [Candidatus Delongbacteria bacterium]
MSRTTRLGWHSRVLILSAALLATAAPQGALAGLQAHSTQRDGSLILELDFPQPDLSRERVDGVSWDLIEMAGSGWVGQPGAPDLPAFHQLIQIPDRSGIQLTILDLVEEPLHGLQPMPNQERLHTEVELPLPWLQDADVYQSNEEFPGRLFELDQPVLLRDRRLVNATFFPVQVNPLTGEGRLIRHMTVRVSFEGENLVNAGSGPLADPTPVLGRMGATEIISLDHPDAEAMDVTAFNPGWLPGHYLVFANATALQQAGLQDLIEWKRRRGHRVTVVSSSDITFTTTAIRTRITQEYNSADPVDFVLLVGDTDGSYALPADGTGYDHYYACVAGNDVLGDVAVGRLSCENATQLNSICYKIIGYESAPYMEDDAEWLKSVGLTVGSSHCALSMKILSRNIAAEMVERYGYTDIDTNFCVGAGSLPTWFASGISHYNYRGWIGMDGLDQTTVLNLAQGPRTPVATIFTCSTGDFSSEDDYSENFLRAGSVATPGGAVAGMGFATASTHTRYNNVIVGGYYAGLLEHDLPEIGACLLQGKFELYQTLPAGDGQIANFSNWGNLMGDPGTCQWLGEPALLALEGVPGSLSPGVDHLSLTVTTGGQPVENAAVCVYQTDDANTILLQHAVLSDAEGRATLPLDGLAVGTLQLTVTKKRHLPILQDLPVSLNAQDVAVSDVTLPGGLLPGAANQSVGLSLHNTGSVALTGLSVAFSLDEALGQLNAPVQTPADLAADGTLVLDNISLSPVSTLSDGEWVPVLLQVGSDQGDFERSLWLEVSAPQPSLTGTTTPGGPLSPGQTRTLRLQIRNLGSVTANDLMVELASENAYYGQVASPPQSVGDLAPDATASVDFSILVNTLTMIGYQLPLSLTWSTADGATGGSELLAVVGTPGVGDPTGPDGYGYWAFEDDDSTYDMAPVYAWIPVAPSEGGLGTEVPLTDNGDEQDDSLPVALPFPFTYYGVTYNEVMVCSNGFISFDDFGFGEVDFRNHYMPSGMGPDAMIAPMWDDHMTTGTPGVWTWHDAVEHRFVISWLALPANQSGGPNTFQLVLYDPLYYPTMTGDGPFLFQYQDFNDTQTAWTDFPNCTVGIKDETSLRGMTLRNATANAATMHTITDGTAIFFTTSAASSLTPPALSLSDTQVSVAVVSGDVAADSLLIRNEGELPLIWSATLLEDALASRDSGGPDGFGYVWKDNQEDDGPNYAWQAPAGAQTLTFVDHDTATQPLELGYTQFLYGEAFQQVRVSPNGYLGFGADNGSSANVELPSPAAPAYMVAAWWDDLKPEPAHPEQVWWWTNHTDSLIVAWDGVSHFNPFVNGGPVRAQAILKANGEVTIQIASLGGGLYPVNTGGTCGVQGEAGAEGFSFFHNQDASALLPWSVRMEPPAWVIPMGSMSGLVAGGDSSWVSLQFTSVPGFPLPNGTYETGLLFTTNDLSHLQLTLPVSMQVSGNAVAEPTLPGRTELTGAWPNPFNPATRLAFTLAHAGRARLSLYNVLGQEVATLVDGALGAGTHQVSWDASGLASGLYLAVLQADGVRDEQKLMLLK